MNVGVAAEFARQLSLQIQSEQLRRDDDAQRRERAIMFLERGDSCCEMGFEVGLEWADEKFAWRLRGKIVSRTHSQ